MMGFIVQDVLTLLFQRPGDIGLEIAPGKEVEDDPNLKEIGNIWNAVPKAREWTPLDPIPGEFHSTKMAICPIGHFTSTWCSLVWHELCWQCVSILVLVQAALQSTLVVRHLTTIINLEFWLTHSG